jgi:hypothetical protein
VGRTLTIQDEPRVVGVQLDIASKSLLVSYQLTTAAGKVVDEGTTTIIKTIPAGAAAGEYFQGTARLNSALLVVVDEIKAILAPLTQ